jgi:hypothetical protein
MMQYLCRSLRHIPTLHSRYPRQPAGLILLLLNDDWAAVLVVEEVVLVFEATVRDSTQLGQCSAFL